MNDARIKRIGLLLLMVSITAIYGRYLYESPVYLAHDEVAYAVNAHSIATSWRDVNGRLLPLYFIASRVNEIPEEPFRKSGGFHNVTQIAEPNQTVAFAVFEK